MSRNKSKADMNIMRAKIFVGGLPPSQTSESLREFFLRFGAIRDAQVLSNRETGRAFDCLATSIAFCSPSIFSCILPDGSHGISF